MPEPETQVLLRRQERLLRRLMADIAKSVRITKDLQARVGMQARRGDATPPVAPAARLMAHIAKSVPIADGASARMSRTRRAGLKSTA